MRQIRVLAVAGLLVWASSAAFAFQETQVGNGAAPAADAAVPAGKATGVPGVELVTPEAAPSNGTEIRLPMLGVIGKLPKLDFGLELLYGAETGRPTEVEPVPGDDVMIRGTVKHRF